MPYIFNIQMAAQFILKSCGNSLSLRYVYRIDVMSSNMTNYVLHIPHVSNDFKKRNG